jgi:hypothetical protein
MKKNCELVEKVLKRTGIRVRKKNYLKVPKKFYY